MHFRKLTQRKAIAWLFIPLLCWFSADTFASEKEIVQKHLGAQQAFEQGLYEEALGLSQEAYNEAFSEFGPQHQLTYQTELSFARMLLDLGNPDPSLNFFQDLKNKLEPQWETYKELYIPVIEGLAQLHAQAGRYELSLGLLQDYTRKDSQPALSLQSLSGQMYLALGQLDQAKLTYQEALAQHESQSNEPTYFAAKEGLAQVYRQSGQFALAVAIYQPLFEQKKAVFGEADLEPWLTLAELAETLRKQGAYEQAEPKITQALEKIAAILGKEDATYWQYSVFQAQLFQDMGFYPQAKEKFTEILEAELAIYGDQDPNYIIDLNNLAGTERLMGDWNASREHYGLALKQAMMLWGENNPQTLGVLNNIALLTENQGLYEEAEPLYLKSLDISTKLLGAQNPTTLSLSNNLAMLYEGQGSFAKALKTYQKALGTAEKAFGKEHPTTTAIENNLGYLYLVTGDYLMAEKRFAVVYQVWSKSLGDKHQRTLKAQNNLARVFAHQKQYKKAEPLFITALTTREAVLGEDHQDAIRSRIDYAAMDIELGRIAEAKTLLYKALKSGEKTLGDKHPYYFEALNLLAKAQEAEGDDQAALKTLQDVFEKRTAFFNRVLWAAGENTRAGYIKLHKPELYNLYRLLAKAGDEDSAKLALQASLDRKGLLLKISSAIHKVQAMTKDPEIKEIAISLQKKKRALAKSTLAGSEGKSPKEFRKAQDELENDINDLERQLGAKSAPFAKKSVQVSADQLLANLEADDAFVDYLYYEDQEKKPKMLALVISDVESRCIGFFTCHKKVLKLISLGDIGPIREAVTFLREIIQDEYAEPEDLTMAAQDAYTQIYAPIYEAVKGHKNLFVVPEDALYLLPYDAMMDGDGKYLIESQAIRVLSSGVDLVAENGDTKSDELMIVAGPDYFVQQNAVKHSSGRRGALAVNAKGLRGLSFEPLDGAEAEGKNIQKMYTKKTVIYTQKGAAEAVLHNQTGVPPKILHIATHGFFLKPEERLKKRLLSIQRGGNLSTPPPGDNPLFRAGLAFAGINANAPLLGFIDGDNDGVLTAQEVLDLNLYGTNLVVLSACETGVGEIEAGEGVYGLRRSFQEAGVRTVVNSLWPVSDEGTMNLMTGFYTNIQSGIGPRQALRDSKLHMLAQDSWQHPYFWSAFVMVGPRS